MMRAPDPTLAPRKLPTQERAKVRIRRVLEATQLILNRDGPSAVTTPAIAAESGVSVGSIYQYFPNKEAIILALYQERLAQIRETAAAKAALDDEQDWRAFFRKWIGDLKRQEQVFGYDLALSAAFDYNPRLSEIEPIHAELIAREVIGHLKRFGSSWPDDALFDLAIYVYYLDAASWRYWSFAGSRLPQAVDRLVEAAIATLAPALEGGSPPPPPYAPPRLSRS